MTMPTDGPVPFEAMTRMAEYEAAYAGRDDVDLVLDLQVYDKATSDNAAARTAGVERALAESASHVWFVDRDTVPPLTALDRLLSRRLDVVGGLYFWRVPPFAPMTFDKPPGDGRSWVTLKTDWKLGGLVRVFHTGLGCRLVRTGVFRKLERPWFRWGWKPEGSRHNRMGDDLFFDYLLDKAGIPVYVDTSFWCIHYNTSRLFESDHKNRPIEMWSPTKQVVSAWARGCATPSRPV